MEKEDELNSLIIARSFAKGRVVLLWHRNGACGYVFLLV